MIFIRHQFTTSTAGFAVLMLALITSPAFSATPTFLPPTSQSQPDLVPFEESSYTLGAGDRIQIDLFDVPEYSGENGRRQVLVDGTINLPLLGSLSVRGMSLKQAEAELSKRYARFYKRSAVTVTLLAPRPLSIGVLGEVSRPGTYTIPLASQDVGTQFPTLTRALQTAGGITQAADVRQVQICRPQRVGAPQIITVDLWNYVQNGSLQQDVTLRDGDSISVVAAANPNPAESLLLADTTFAGEKGRPINVAIVGEVFRPGSYQVIGTNARTGAAGAPGTAITNTANNADKPPTITQAIQAAGGIKPLADIRRIQIRRPTRSGAEQTIDINLLALVQTGDLKQDVILQSGDTISIPTATDLTAAAAAQIASASFSPDTTPQASSSVGASPFMEAFRSSLYKNIRLQRTDASVRSLTISSAEPGDGKSTIAVNLAHAAAAMGQRVLLVDADLRHPQVHHIMELSNQCGLSDVMTTNINVRTALQPSPTRENLMVLTAGQTPIDPVELLSSGKMRVLMERFQMVFDLVIYDTPPLVGLADGSLVASQTNGLVLVVRLGKTKRPSVAQAMEELKISSTAVLGLVANGAVEAITPYSYHYQPYVKSSNGAAPVEHL